MTKFIQGVHASYKEQFDKITEAYFKNELKPWEPCACFVGNLLDNHIDWIFVRWIFNDGTVVLGQNRSEEEFSIGSNVIEIQSNGLYLPEEICRLEGGFMYIIENNDSLCEEDALFSAMNYTLDLLRTIHESKGEIIDAPLVFTKRQLQKV